MKGETSMTLYKPLLLALIIVLALTGCSSKSWDWFFDDEEEVKEIVFDDEIEVENGLEEDEFSGEGVEEIVYVYVDEDGNELYREVVSAKKETSEESPRRLNYDGQMADEEAMPPTRRPTETAMKGKQAAGRLQEASGGQPNNNIVQFDYKKARTGSAGMHLLEAHAAYLQKNPDLIVTIEGHTDSVASREYNKRLGLQRARMVADILEEMGVSPSQIVTVSYGEERPLHQGNSERAHKMNRRVELMY